MSRGKVISVTKISTAHARKIVMSSFIDHNSFIDLDQDIYVEFSQQV